MATKEQVTEYIDNQFEKGGNDYHVEYWEGNNGARLGLIQNWMSPKIAKILRKLVGDAIMVEAVSRNGSNKE
jgi:hypothetical protein